MSSSVSVLYRFYVTCFLSYANCNDYVFSIEICVLYNLWKGQIQFKLRVSRVNERIECKMRMQGLKKMNLQLYTLDSKGITGRMVVSPDTMCSTSERKN